MEKVDLTSLVFKHHFSYPKGVKSPFWKGNTASYSAIHNWVRNEKGTPKKCEHCQSTNAKVYDWANVDHKYKRVLDDYIRLCRKCHILYDKQHNSYKS